MFLLDFHYQVVLLISPLVVLNFFKKQGEFPHFNCPTVSDLAKILSLLACLRGLCKLHCSTAGSMNRDVFLLGHKLDMTGIHAVLIEAAVMKLPSP